MIATTTLFIGIFQGTSRHDPPKTCKAVSGSHINVDAQTLSESVKIVGTPFTLNYSTEYAPDYVSPYNNLGYKNVFNPEGWTLSAHHYYDSVQSRLYLGTGRSVVAEKFVAGSGNYLVVSEDASEVYIFHPTGRHLQTLTGLRGTLKYQFNYNGSGKLIKITDNYSNETLLNRNGSGQLEEIVGPYGQTTEITVNGSGLIDSVENPNGEKHEFTYKTSTGLLETFKKPGGQTSTFTYDGDGRLIKDLGHGGNFWEFVRDTMDPDKPLYMTSKLGRETKIVVTKPINGPYSRTEIHPDGLQSVYENYTDGLQVDYDIRRRYMTSVTNDERFGAIHQRVAEEYVRMGPASTGVENSTSYSQSVSSPSGYFGYGGLTLTSTSSGRVHTKVFNASTMTWTNTSDEGAVTTLKIDANERPVEFKVGNDTKWEYSYDGNGRLEEIIQGTNNRLTFTYNNDGYLQNVENVRNEDTSMVYDLAGRVTQVTLPDSRVISYGYDANGNLTSVTPPSRPAHAFTFNGFELMSGYQPPSIGMGIDKDTTYTYNDDKQLIKIERPDGNDIEFTYDSSKGHLTHVTTPAGDFINTYNGTTGLRTVARGPYNLRNRFTYYGIIPASDAQERPSDNFVFGKTSFTFDANHRVASRTVEGGVSGSSTANYTHNDDDYPTQIGSMALTYSYPSGRLSTTTIGNITDTRTYDTYGNLESYTAVWNPTTTTLYSYTLTRDDGGRIIEKSETIQGVTSLYEYTYDSAGRLTQVDKDSVTQSTFTYDNNSNRTSGTIDGVAFTATYDDQDRMLTFNSRNYTYNRNGELSKIEYSMGVESDYTYDVLGNLRQVDLSSGDVVVYGIDGLSRRATKSKNSAGIYRHIFEDQHRISAFVNGSGQLIRSYVYGTRLNVPDYLYIVSTSSTHKIITDHLGSPRLVVNVSNGSVNQRMDYNVLGYVTNDTNPGFTPFGFAGGIYDPDTKLVRFGARDYDTETGRWTAKDPIRFNGGDTNLYGYVLNDPVNFVDHSGKSVSGISLIEGGGGGANKCEQYKKCKKTIRRIQMCIPPLLLGPVGTFARSFLTGYSMAACEPFSIEEKQECIE